MFDRWSSGLDLPNPNGDDLKKMHACANDVCVQLLVLHANEYPYQYLHAILTSMVQIYVWRSKHARHIYMWMEIKIYEDTDPKETTPPSLGLVTGPTGAAGLLSFSVNWRRVTLEAMTMEWAAGSTCFLTSSAKRFWRSAAKSRAFSTRPVSAIQKW